MPGWPVAVRSAGHAVFTGDWVEHGKRRNVLMVLWSLAGSARYRTPDADHDLPAGTWLWIPPATPHDLGAASLRWEARWLTVDGPAVAAWTAGWSPPVGPCRPCRALDIDGHEWLVRGVTEPTRQRLLACLDRATALLADGLQGGGGDDLVHGALKLIEVHHADPDFDVAALARLLGRHRSHLSRDVARRTGAGPGEHLRQRRIRAAKELLLRDPRARLAAVAAACGFGGPDQLARAFRRDSGVTPSAWRDRIVGLW